MTSSTELRNLFDKLDKNKDGKIDFNELREYFNELNAENSKPKLSQTDTKNVFEKMASTNNYKNVHLDFRDFVKYVTETDRKMQILFQDLDLDKNGIIDREEIKRGFENLEIILSDAQIDKLLENIDKNNSLQIDWHEWRDFFRFAPHDRIEEALRYWRIQTFLDYADQSIPNDFTKKEKESGLWLRNLVAGGLAGAISRTCTAPLDRVRIFLQVHGFENKIGINQAIKNMIKEGGIKSMWRGNS